MTRGVFMICSKRARASTESMSIGVEIETGAGEETGSGVEEKTEANFQQMLDTAQCCDDQETYRRDRNQEENLRRATF